LVTISMNSAPRNGIAYKVTYHTADSKKLQGMQGLQALRY